MVPYRNTLHLRAETDLALGCIDVDVVRSYLGAAADSFSQPSPKSDNMLETVEHALVVILIFSERSLA